MALISIDHNSPEAHSFNAQMDGLSALLPEPSIRMGNLAAWLDALNAPFDPSSVSREMDALRAAQRPDSGFQDKLDNGLKGMDGYWNTGAPVAKTSSILDTIADVTTSVVAAVAPSASQDKGVRVGGLSAAMNNLSLSRADRYKHEVEQQQINRPKGNDYA